MKGHNDSTVQLITCVCLSTESFVRCSKSESWRWWFINDGHTARRDERKEAMREKVGDWAGEIFFVKGGVEKVGFLRTSLFISHPLV